MSFTLTLENLEALCRRQGLACKVNAETGQIAVHGRALDSDAPLYVIPYAGRGVVAFVVPLPFRVPAARIPFVAEAVTRLGGAACAGAWTLDIESGELSFRIALPIYGASYDDDGVMFVVRLARSAVDAAARDLYEIALAGKTSREVWPRSASVPG